MTFLNPLLLVALPLIALPILIHLINQRRYQTVQWGAMMFLLSAKKMSKGMARLRQILIMVARMAAIAGLIFAIGRPLATGWFGALTGGKPETIIVILDRSASMQQQKLDTGETKIATGLSKIAEMVAAYDGTNRLVLIESTSNKPIEIDSASSLVTLPATGATDASADVAGMLQTAFEFVTDNQTGRTDVWICSDARENDWDHESSRWPTIQSQFSELDGIRFHVLNYAQPPHDNYSVVVEQAELITTSAQSELAMDIRIRRSGNANDEIEIPVNIAINGVRSVTKATITNDDFFLAGHRIQLDKETKSGWGFVELPADSNASDNRFYFSFAKQPVFETVIVSDTPSTTRALQVACSTATRPHQKLNVGILSPDQLNELAWDTTALILWQAPLPEGQTARQVSNFLSLGRNVVFFPPEQTSGAQFQGVSWGDWTQTKQPEDQVVGFWRNQDDLLKKTMSGQALPVDEIKIYQYCRLNSPGRVLAKVNGGDALLSRAMAGKGGAYFCSTWPAGTHSSLARNGVVIFAILHRALAGGAASLGAAKQTTAGSPLARLATKLKPMAGRDDNSVWADARPYLAGVYGDDHQTVAINRPSVEDTAPRLTGPQIDALFTGLDFHVIDDQLGNARSLASEIWKLFIALMGIALLLEAALCLPAPLETSTDLQLRGSAQ